jgi:NAD(P)-dependent dehydrogenase (short-subunit alcohol dehydrogenase family)
VTEKQLIDLTGRVAVVTGAGGGLGRAHALLLAKRGAKVVVNDLGDAAEAVVGEITAAGGAALAFKGSVTDFDRMQAMADAALGRWGRIDILVNNAGILRDKTFAKMSMDDFRLVIEVHLIGAANCTKVVWETMRAQQYGRIVMTSSSSGLYGNFGQANYGAAKMALVGLMQTLALEGAKYNIRVNCIAPSAATNMLEGLMSPETLAQLPPERVSPAILALVRQDAPTRTILCAGAGGFETANITMTRGIYLPDSEEAAESLVTRWDEVIDRTAEIIPAQGGEQATLELAKTGYNVVPRTK